MRRFREAAIPLERWWVEHLGTLWPRGYNTTIPGQPIGTWALRTNNHRPSDGNPNNPDPADLWVQHWRQDSSSAINCLAQQPKHVLRDILHHLQAKHTALLEAAGPQSPVPHIINLLRDRRAEAPTRQFLRFRFSHNSARDLALRDVLRLPSIYTLHPDPSAVAAIMVSYHFSLHIQSLLFNYTPVSRDLSIHDALQDSLDGCDCRLTLLPLTPDDLSPEGHVCTFDLTRLKWPYLRPFAEKGKKFRLPAQASTVEQELRAGLEQYLTWALQKNQDPEAERNYRAWASAVQAECMQRWRTAQLAAEETHGPEGYPGLRAALTEAHTHLVFVPDDRAPHGIYAICCRLYCRSLATHLSSPEHFRVIDHPWSDILSDLKASLSNIGFECSTGLPYTYGVWKPLKRKFRFICGCHKPPPPPPAPSDAPANPEPSRSSHSKEKPAPPRVPTDKLDEALVKVLGIAMRSLRHKDTDLHQRTGLRRYWIVESPEEFARLARIHSSTLSLVIADFTTMYTCFNQETMVTRIMDALKEAQAYEATRTPEVEGEQPLLLTTTGWSRWQGWTLEEVEHMLRLTLSNCYTTNGGIVRQQVQGVPMGWRPAPQATNLACYVVERDWVEETGAKGFACRYIDDLFTAGVPLPPQERYGMEYKVTSDNPHSVVYIGVRVTTSNDRLRTLVHDRELEYPYHIVRYPEWSSTAPRTQLGGVIFGRFTFAHEICSDLDGFKQAVGHILRHALYRHYPIPLLKSVWSRFLFRKWAGDVGKA